MPAFKAHFRPNRAPVRRVALYLSRAESYGRGLLAGIHDYTQAHAHGRWELLIVDRFEPDVALELLRDFKPDGILFMGEADRMAVMRRLSFPAVSVTSYEDIGDIPRVQTDHRSVAQAAVAHFVERGLRRCAIFQTGDTKIHGMIRVAERYEDAVKSAGLEFARFVHGPRSREGWTLGKQLDDLTEWLAAQPRPMGLLCSDDDHGWRALTACRRAGIDVPNEVAVVGINNDVPLCESCDPPLSSIDSDQARIGYEGVRLLDRLISGESVSREPVNVPVLGIVVRQSSDTFAIADPEVARALQFIHDHLDERIEVKDVLNHVQMSLSTLTRRFKRHLGRTPGAEIRRARIEYVKRQIIRTGKSLAEIAADSGYDYISQLSRDIKRSTGSAPTELRRQHRTV